MAVRATATADGTSDRKTDRASDNNYKADHHNGKENAIPEAKADYNNG